MSTLRLVPVSGPPIEIEKEQSMVGRDPGCDIVVSDGSVSRRHARLELRGNEWWVIDQGSANGTYINSVRVAEQAIKAGQELRFGALSFQVDLVEDPEATVATPVLDENVAATVVSAEPPVPPSTPPPAPAPKTAPPETAPPANGHSLPPPLPSAPRAATPPRPATPPPAPRPPSAPRAATRPVPPSGASRRPGAPVPQMAGDAPARKGRSPFFWVAVGCCGCLLLLVVLMAVIGGGAYISTKGAADAAHAWIADVRAGGAEAGAPHLSAGYASQIADETSAAVTAAIQKSDDATFFQRSIENDRAVMRGLLTGHGSTQPITVHLVKEGGRWKVDSVVLAAQ
jgi:predicted component of type VI protein secretion system